jgi:hypothetical protein
MSKELTDVDSYVATVTSPVDGDAVTGAAIENGLQDLANRTYFLKQRLMGSAGGDEFRPSLAALVRDTLTWSYDASDLTFNWRQYATGSEGFLVFELILPKMGVINSLTAVVKGGPGHSALPGTMP